MAVKKKNPRISINKLGEYTEANSTRRKKIIKDAKEPEPFITTRYKDVREIIPAYLKSGLDEDVINDRIAAIRKRPKGTDFVEEDKTLSIKLLEIILDTDLSRFSAFKVEAPPENIIMNMSGIEVSVNPDIILKFEKKGVINVGCMKLILNKTKISIDALKTISAANHKYLTEHVIKKGQVANAKMCFTYHVYQSDIESSPNTYVSRIKILENSCEEIAIRWPTI